MVAVKCVTTRSDGRRCLIVQMQGPEGQPEVWLDDTFEHRRVLNMRPIKDTGEKPEPQERSRTDYGPRHEHRDWNEGDRDDRDDEIPF